MDFKRVFKKYIILLLIYLVITRFINPFGLKIYYSIIENPIDNPNSIEIIESVMRLIEFIVNLIFVIFMIIDTKSKKLIDWLIMIVTFLNPGIGIALFIVWNYYKLNE
ncbi:hypothetical protein [Flavobacteriaceae bacterium 14752]|uniref:hypothetical protein n=1 Tax=Mesohalobacter salilacus TaxID=2491711 RepID=UPI000F642486|nr:hypothetical protein EIG84_08925 [Flavobacteriaceae bacterium 14752]